MTDTRNIRFATDLVTFYSPSFWGGSGDLDGIRHLYARGDWDPSRFWERILDSAREAGLDGIEITFPPGDWRSAGRVYGSAQGFAAAARDRGLEVCSGFFSHQIPGRDRPLDIGNPDDRGELLELIDEYAAFLSACGADVMVTALPNRRSRDADPPLFVDLKLAEPIVDTLNQAGAAALRRGVKLALHPEAFSLFRNSRDVDLFMLLTDPTYVFLCPDTAQFVVAGSNPIAIADRHRDRLALTHWKDAVGAAPPDVSIDDTIFARQVQWFAPVGEGVVDWPAWLRLLRDLRYQGWAVFELDTAPDPIGELQRIKAYVEQALAPIYR